MQIDQGQFESPLTGQEQALRDLFVAEYLKDFDPLQACIRVGFIHTFATQYAIQFMNEGYVRRQILHFTRKPVKAADQDSEDRALLETTLKQAMQHGPYASRVAAGKAFAELKGWNKPDDSGDVEQSLIDALRDFAQVAPV